MERTAPHVTRWPAEILGFSERDMLGATHSVRLGLRQTQGFMAPIGTLMGLAIGRQALW